VSKWREISRRNTRKGPSARPALRRDKCVAGDVSHGQHPSGFLSLLKNRHVGGSRACAKLSVTTEPGAFQGSSGFGVVVSIVAGNVSRFKDICLSSS
jgi:hypothetical protein